MRRIALFAHYDAQAEIKPYVLFYLQRLKEICTEVLFISNAPLSERESEKAKTICSRVLLRENMGYDFGMWRDGIETIDPTAWDEVVLANSSVFGPIRPLDSAFLRMAEVDCDFWGMTESKEIGWHLQSYFIVFRRRLLTSDCFLQFWKTVLPYRDKLQVVRSYEIGMSTFFREQGFVSAAFVPASAVPVRWFRRNRPNPTLQNADVLIECGMPFVKVQLLRENPFGTRLDPVYSALEAAGYDCSFLVFDRPRPAR